MNLTTEKIMATKSNATEQNKAYTVRGDIYLRTDGEFEAVRNGQVLSNDDNALLAYFGVGVAEPLSVIFASVGVSAEAQISIVEAIQDFASAAKGA